MVFYASNLDVSFLVDECEQVLLQFPEIIAKHDLYLRTNCHQLQSYQERSKLFFKHKEHTISKYKMVVEDKLAATSKYFSHRIPFECTCTEFLEDMT